MLFLAFSSYYVLLKSSVPLLIPIYGSIIKVTHANHFISTLHIATKFYSEAVQCFFPLMHKS